MNLWRRRYFINVGEVASSSWFKIGIGCETSGIHLVSNLERCVTVIVGFKQKMPFKLLHYYNDS